MNSAEEYLFDFMEMHGIKQKRESAEIDVREA